MIFYNDNLLVLNTKNTTYSMKVVDYGFLEHLYYGKRINDVTSIDKISNRQIYSFNAGIDENNRQFSKATLLSEVSIFGSGDFRNPSVILNDDYDFRFDSYKIYKDIHKIEGLPQSRDTNTETLEITLKNINNVIIKLFYTVYENEDVIARHQVLINNSNKEITFSKFASMNLDFYENDFDSLTLNGMYLSERGDINRNHLKKGIFVNQSIVGTSSHHANPFIALLNSNATEYSGDVYGFNLVYSGSFKEEIEIDRLENTRVTIGISDLDFKEVLKKGEEFYSPECIMTYSSEGLNQMSLNMHNHIKNNIIERKYAFKTRPIVVNTWEPFFFTVDEEKVLLLARKAKEIGADTVVLDDGWFRNNDKYGLGKWEVIKEKFKNGIEGLSEKVHQLGLNFGIWIEPEMVNDKNDFNILSSQNIPLVSRNQYVIDLTDDNQIYKVFEKIKEALGNSKIDYIKWDYNRYPLDISKNNEPIGSIIYRQTLGSYKLFELIKNHYNCLIESCSGGGGRFDLGMLYYSPQIWTSDNTDPYERAFIQYNVSIAYPLSTVSSHLTEGVCTSGRPSTYDFRYLIASTGIYGYELNILKKDDEEIKKLNALTSKYKEDRDFVLNGDFYRLIDPLTNYCAYIQVLKNKEKGKFTFLELNSRGLKESMTLKLKGLDPSFKYKVLETNDIYSGEVLLNSGIRIGNLFREIRENGLQLTFVKL